MFAGDDETDGHHGLTDYELERVAHIRRNREIMRQLGLGDHDIVTAARARCGEKDGASAPSGKRRRMEKRNAKRESETVEAGIERVLRRSRRLLNTPTVNAEGDQTTEGLPDEDDDEQYSSVDGYKKKHLSKYLSEYEVDERHEKDARAYALRNAGNQARVSVVGTASYQHTLMRVRTMSDSGLANRIKAIERAKGKHAVVKMRLFARVLFLEGNESLADDATAALRRLIEELGDPDEDDNENENDNAEE